LAQGSRGDVQPLGCGREAAKLGGAQEGHQRRRGRPTIQWVSFIIPKLLLI
jgi:hypothetical protein